MSRPRSHRANVDPSLNRGHLAIGLLTVLVAIGILVVSMRAQDGVPGTSHYDLVVQFGPTAQAPVLPPRGSDVRIAGKRVGQTQQTGLEHGVATLHLQLDGGVAKLPADSRVEVRSQGLLGAKYVDVAPGASATTLPAGSVIPAGRSSIATTLSDVMQALDAEPRNGLRKMLRGLGGGLAGRGAALNAALVGLGPAVRGFSRTFHPLLGDHTLPGLIGAADTVTGAFDGVRDELAGTFAPAERAVRPLAQERASVDRLLAVAPGSLDGARRGLAGTDPLLARATAFAGAAADFTKVAPRALRSVTALLRDGRRPLGSARGVLLAARAAVPPTLQLTGALDPVLPRLQSVLEVAQDPTRTVGAYGCDITRWGQTWRSFLGFAPRGQSGPLGPLAILRTTLVLGGGVPGLPNPTPGAKVDGNITPCEPDRGQP